MIPSLTAAFIMGLMGSVHCIGMCGGLACALNYASPKAERTPSKIMRSQIIYNVGRIMTYGTLGALAGYFGTLALQPIYTQAAFTLRIFSAVFVILVGFYIIGLISFIAHIEYLGKHLWMRFQRGISYVLTLRAIPGRFVTGVIWGMLPCGLVYSALMYAVGAGSGYKGALIMFCFGLGTLPALLLAGSSLHSYHGFLARRGTRYIFGTILVMLGVMMLAQLIYHQIIHSAA